MDTQFLQSRIDKTKATILLYEDAIDALVAGVQSYKLDTGQDSQMVTQHNLGELNKQVEMLLSRLDTYQARLGGGTIIYAPGF